MGYQGKFTGAQVDERLTNAGDIPDMKSDIATLLSNVGKPDVIDDASEFATADHSKVYAYMGETTASYTHEHWYYYKNGEWTDGGVWGSAVAIDDELETEGAAADAKATGNAVKLFKDNLFYQEEQLTSPEIIAANNNTAVTNNGDGTYSIGTNNYGNTIFGSSRLLLDVGYYLLYGVPNGIAFLSPVSTMSETYNNRVFENTSPEPKIIHVTESTLLWVCYRVARKPSSEYVIAPSLIKMVPIINSVVRQTEQIENDLLNHNSFDIIERYGIQEDGISHGLTFEWAGKTCTVSGNKEEGTSFNNVVRTATKPGGLPPGVRAGDICYFQVESTDPENVYMDIYFVEANGNLHLYIIKESQNIKIPDYTANITYRVRVRNEATNVNAEITVGWLNSPSNQILQNEINNLSKKSRNHLRILQLGHSTTLDSWAYVPFILKNYGITVDIVHEYRSGQKMSQLVSEWNNDTVSDAWTATINTLNGDTAWSRTERIAPKTLVELGNYDIIVVANAGTNFNENYTVIYEPYTMQIFDLIRQSVDKSTPVWLIYTTVRHSADYPDRMVATAEAAFNRYPFNGVLSPGLGIFNARTNPTLAALGDSEYHNLWCTDDIHIQNGIPRYIMALTIVQQLFDRFFPGLSVMYDELRVTEYDRTAWKLDWATGNHGNVTGINEENCFLAQQAAILAARFPLTIKNLNDVEE